MLIRKRTGGLTAVLLAIGSAPIQSSSSLLSLSGLTFAATFVDFAVSAPSRQLVFSTPESDWNPLHHAAGIAAYFDSPGADVSPPSGCKVTAAAFLIRHSSIYANDDEWKEYMQPFVQRVYANREAFQDTGPLAFLKDWQSPINDDNLEQLTQPGIKDAESMGKRISKLYPHLLPPRDLGKGKQRDDDNVTTPFKIWTASSSRDIGTAKAWIRGAFPKRHEGNDGGGDGKYLTLVEVPNKDPDWSASLTPHKVCNRFTKEDGKRDARKFLSHWGTSPLEKLRRLAPLFDWQLNDVIALPMLCGYESVIDDSKKSAFCNQAILDKEDWLNFEYFNDIFYDVVVGSASPVAPALGVHWLNTSLHNLLAADEGKGDHPGGIAIEKQKDPHLPIPGGPPNSTHSQRFFAYFTHREEPPVALVALGLFNETKPLPLDQRDDNRLWKSSHILPFLGHAAIERLSCSSPTSTAKGENGKDALFTRVVVNGAVQRLDHCQSGPGHSCPMQQFSQFIEKQMELYGDFEKACQV